MVPVLVIVTAEVQTRVGRVEVPVIRRAKNQGTDCVRDLPLYFHAAFAAENPLWVIMLFGLRAGDMQEGGGCGPRPPAPPPLSGEFLEAAADVRVGDRRGIVAHIEQPVVPVLVIVTAEAQTRAGRVEVPVIRRVCGLAAPRCRGVNAPLQACLLYTSRCV